MPSDDAAPQFSRSEIRTIMIGLMLAMFLASLDQTVVATALTSIARDLGGWEIMSWVVSAYLVASTVTTPIYGKLGDLYGRRAVLMVAIVFFMLGAVACALADSMMHLIAARVLQGIGGGGLRAVSQAVVADIVPPRERGKIQGYFTTVFATTNVVGPVLGGLIADTLTWHWIFWLDLPFGALAMAFIWWNLRRLPRPTQKPVIDWLGAVLILASTTPILIGLSRANQAEHWLDPTVAGPIALGSVLGVALVLRERVAPEPMLPLHLFTNRIFAVACYISFVVSMVMIALIIIVPIDYQLASGLSASDAGARLIPMTGGVAVGSFFCGQLLSRTGRYRIFPLVGSSMLTVACAVIAVVGLGHSLAFGIACTGLLGVSFGCHMAPMTVAAQNALATRDTGVGMAMLMFSRLIGGAVGVALLGSVLIGALDDAARAVPGHEVLGPKPGIALFQLDRVADTLDPMLRAALAEATRSAFSQLFWVAAGIAACAAVGALFLKELPLRGR